MARSKEIRIKPVMLYANLDCLARVQILHFDFAFVRSIYCALHVFDKKPSHSKETATMSLYRKLRPRIRVASHGFISFTSTSPLFATFIALYMFMAYIGYKWYILRRRSTRYTQQIRYTCHQAKPFERKCHFVVISVMTNVNLDCPPWIQVLHVDLPLFTAFISP